MPAMLEESSLKSIDKIESLEQIFSLSKQQQQNFLDHFNHSKNKEIEPNLRVYKYLQNKLTNFNFYTDTLVASESLEHGSGNCLSLAILTKSLTELANIDIRYEIVETAPIYQRSNEILLITEHIRTTLFHNSSNSGKTPKYSLKDISIDYYPNDEKPKLKLIDENEFYSKFYTNKAASSLVSGNNETAYWYIKHALQLYPNDLSAISMMGIVHNRLGYPEIAEQLYQYGLTIDLKYRAIIKNYYVLLKQQNRLSEAKILELKLKQHQAANPFTWIDSANMAYAENNFPLAIKHYKKASRIANYLHQPYAGIARSKKQQGKTNAARKAIIKAIENLHTIEDKKAYKKQYQQFLLSL